MSSTCANENCLGWAARDTSGILSPYKFTRRAVGKDDVSLSISFCGVCYADVVWTRSKFGHTHYPVVPGSWGVMSHSRDLIGWDDCCSVGYKYAVVQERIPDNYTLKLAAPLLCAGITVFAPMMHHKMNQPGKTLGVIGLGGLGHLAVKFGKAFGLKVTVFSTSISKREEALKLLGADSFVLSSDKEQMMSPASLIRPGMKCSSVPTSRQRRNSVSGHDNVYPVMLYLCVDSFIGGAGGVVFSNTIVQLVWVHNILPIREPF